MTNAAFWTDFADGSIMFPLGIAVSLILAVMGQRRAALGWTVAIGGVWAVILVLKLAGYTLAAISPDSAFSTLDLVTPSGHVASAASIYGGLIALLLSRPGSRIGRALLAAIAVAALIGTTRVVLGAHSLAEVIVGGCVGVAGAAALAWLTGATIAARARWPILGAALVIILAFHGRHTTWETTIRQAAIRFSQSWQAPA